MADSTNSFTVKTSYEDVEGLLNTLMMVSTLNLAFAVTLHSGTLSHDDFMAADYRYAKYQFYSKAKNKGIELSEDGLIPVLFGEGGQLSAQIRNRGNVAVFSSVVALLVATFTYLSLSYSNAREETQYFSLWFKRFKWIILLGYVSFFVSIVFFFGVSHLVAKATFPMYNDKAQFYINGSVYENPELYAKSGEPDYRGSNIEGSFGYDMTLESDIVNQATYVIYGVIAVGVVVVDMAVRCNKRTKKRSAVVIVPEITAPSNPEIAALFDLLIKQQKRHKEDIDFLIEQQKRNREEATTLETLLHQLKLKHFID